MKNFVQPGDTVVVAAPAAVNSGDGVVVGAIFGVAVNGAPNGADVPIKTMGVFDLPKAGGDAFAVGDRVYWSAGANECTATATGNYPIGTAVAAAAGGDATVRVRLDGIATVPVA